MTPALGKRLGAEAVGTFELIFAGAGAIVANAGSGGAVGLEAMFAGPVCGASMNPVRSLAPAVVSGQIGGV